MTIEAGANELKTQMERALKSKSGFLAGRFGTFECSLVDLAQTRPSVPIPEEMRAVLERNAGVFPSDVESVRLWIEDTKHSFQAADILALGWYAPNVEKERRLLGAWGWRGITVALRSLEPYYVSPELRWTSVFSGRKVCAVTSFASTAANQVGKNIWNPPLWSDLEWSFVQTGYAPCLALGRAGWEESPSCWQEAVESTCAEVLKTGAQIVVIGCGGLGMSIGARLKVAGKVCIVLGGATQVLFGIKGERWRQHDVIGKFWGPEWVWPSEEETPAGAVEVEGACYWLKGGD